MGLVGDVIMEVRRRIPDIPPVLSPLGSITAVALTSTDPVPFGTYYLVATCLTPWGETTPTAEITLAILGGPASLIAVTPVGLPFGATAVRVYIGNATGQELVWQQFPLTQQGVGGPFLITNTLLQGAKLGKPPTTNTAFMPDDDGDFIGAYGMFNLLKRGLDELCRRADGMVDVTGVQAINGQAMFRVPAINGAPFFNFTNVWFDGYPMDIVARSDIYLRNSVPGFTGIISFEIEGDTPVFQAWPQPNRTGGTTTLSGAMGLTDMVANVVTSTGFLSIGLLQIDNEIMGYSSAQSTSFPNLIRGLGGSVPTTHASGATVTELNLRLSGKRLAATYNPGDSIAPLRIPPAWEAALVLHMLSQVRSMENQDDVADKLLGDFGKIAAEITKASLRSTKPRQVQIGGVGGLNRYNVNGIGFGWLVP